MRKILLVVLFVVLQWNVFAQNLTKSGVLRMSVRNTGTIVRNNQVVGYYYFLKVDKKDRKNQNFILSIYDENLREINSIDIVRPNSTVLVDGAFNGEAFAFLFYDSRSKTVELNSYDNTLKQIGSIKKPVTNKFSMATLNTFVAGSEPTQAYLVAVDNKGFLVYGYKADNKMHYETTFYNNTLKAMWSDKSDDRTQANIEMASEAFQTQKYVGSIITKKKSASSKDLQSFLNVYTVDSGDKLFNISLETNKHSVSFSDVYFDSTAQQFIVFGEYYERNAKELKDASLGFITLTLDLSGKLLAEKTNSWANEISRATPMDARGKFEGLNARVLFHNIVRTADGKIFVVGEQYKKVASGAGIASAVFSAALGAAPTTSTSQINVYNMVLFEFAPDYSVTKVYVFEKDKNVVTLPAGAEYTGSKALSFYAKSVGGFDYAFTQISPDENTFSVSYINYDNEGGEKARNVLGTIVYTPEKTFTVDKLSLSRKSKGYWVYRAKSGYVLISEYFPKEKRLDSRLEKLNY